VIVEFVIQYLEIDTSNVRSMFNRFRLLLTCALSFRKDYRQMSEKIVRIGVCQLNSRDDKEENLRIGEKLINQAKKEQAKVS
jgi:hypothetical protein